jgi:hypothetical protein
MKHPHYSELQRYCDGALTGEALSTVQDHLRICPRCSSVVAQEQAMLHALATSPHSSPGKDFERRILERLYPDGSGISTDRSWMVRYAAMLLGIVTTTLVLILSPLNDGGVLDTQPTMLNTFTTYLTSLFRAIPFPELRSEHRLSPTHSETLEILAAVICVLLFLSVVDRYILQPLLRPRSQRSVASGARDQ